MGRPKTVNIKTFHEYDKLHTVKSKMYCGVEMTTLYPIKETALFYRSIEVWAYCASSFKMKKKDNVLNLNIPIISNQKTINFLEKHCWKDRVVKEIECGNSDIIETVAMLKKIFPDKEAVYFYELENLISAHNQGTLISYDDNGQVKEPSEHQLKRRKWLNSNYNRFNDAPEVKKMQDRWTSEPDKVLKDKYLDEYMDFSSEYAFKHNNLLDVFLEIGQNSVCYPVAFTDNTAEWSKEKYGKLVGYAHAGEIFFVATPDKIFFQISRHF
jgi:hypothetical protein